MIKALHDVIQHLMLITSQLSNHQPLSYICKLLVLEVIIANYIRLMISLV